MSDLHPDVSRSTSASERSSAEPFGAGASLHPRPMRAEWSLVHRVGFRFSVAFFLLYSFFPMLLFLTTLYGPAGEAGLWIDRVWQHVVPWVGVHLFGVSASVMALRNGPETPYFFVQQFCFFATAVLVTVVWSLLDRRRREYATLHDWFRVYVRYALAFSMMVYGGSKVIKSQFAHARLGELTTPFGQFTPMSVLWSFMGYSTAYTIFTGLGEMVGGFFLFFRKTTTLGALIIIAVMTNVVLMNFAYDVPVKVYATVLLLMAIFLVIPDVRRMLDVFVFNRATPAVDLRPPLQRGWGPPLRFVAKLLAIVPMMALPLYRSWQQRHGEYGEEGPRSALYGAYDVDLFVRGRDTVPPLLTDATRWRRLIADFPTAVSVRLMNDSTRSYLARIDTVAKRLTLSSRRDSTIAGTFVYARPDSMHLVLTGMLARDSVGMQLHRIDPQFRLRQPFHLVKVPRSPSAPATR